MVARKWMIPTWKASSHLTTTNWFLSVPPISMATWHKYDVDAEASEPRAEKRIEASAIGVLEDTVTGYNRCQVEDHVVQKEGNEVVYAMAPVWILTTRYEGKPYTFMMNGQTGKMVGSLPYDNMKSYMYMGITTLILLPILYYLMKILMIFA